MRAAIIENNIVKNLVVSSEDFAKERGWYVLSDNQLAGIGWTYDAENDTFDRPDEIKIVPPQITRRQAKQELLLAGLHHKVDEVIDGISDPIEKEMMKLYWNESEVFERDHPSLLLIASELNLSDEEIDDLFIKASEK